MTTRTRSRRHLLAALTAGTLLTLTGCSDADPDRDPNTYPDKSASKSRTPTTPTAPDPTHAPRTAAAAYGTDVDTLVLASVLEMRHVEDGRYPTRAPLDAAPLSPGNTLTGYTATPPGYTFCVVHAETGAWAHYDSASSGITGAGTTGADCIPNPRP